MIRHAHFCIPRRFVRTFMLVAACLSGAPSGIHAQEIVTSGLHAWFRADAGVVVSSGKVTSWTDQSANGFVLTPAATGPGFTASAVNGLPALSFDGTTQLNGALGTVTVGDGSVFALFRYTVPASDNDYLYTLGASSGGGSQYSLSRRADDVAYHYDGAAQKTSGAGVIPALQWMVSSQIYGGTAADTHDLFINGAAQIRSTSAGAYAPLAAPFVIGNWTSGSNRFVGDLVELLVYDRPLIESERRAVEGYLRVRAALPATFQQEAEVISTWDVVQYELNGQPDANWIFDLGGTRADQSVNSDASILLRPGDAAGKVVWGKFGSGSAPDFMGFVFGYQGRGNFYLLDWKKATAGYLSFGTAPAGMRLRKFHVVDGADPVGRDFWAADNPDNVTTMKANDLVWAEGVDYDFSLRYAPGAFVVRIWQGTTVLQEWRVTDSTYTSGRFGYFVNSLQNVRFGQVFVHDIGPVTLRSADWAADPSDSVYLRWTGGEPPYLIERSSDLSAGSWQSTGGHIWARDGVGLPANPQRGFIRVRSVGEQLTNP